MNNNLTPYNADVYEEGMSKTIPFYDEIYSQTINLVRCVRPDVESWLDTGCGTGSLVARSFRVFKKTKYLIADPSMDMLTKAREALKNIPAEQLQVIGNVGTEELPNIKSPQVITAILSHHYFNKTEREHATKKCFNLLDEGGLYVSFENIYPLTEDGKDIGLYSWKQFQISKGKSEKEANEHIRRYGISFFPITLEEHLLILRNSGFRVVELFWFSHLQAGLYAIK